MCVCVESVSWRRTIVCVLRVCHSTHSVCLENVSWHTAGLPSTMVHDTGWSRCTGCHKFQVSFRKRATIYRALLRKETYKDKASYASSPTCSPPCTLHWHVYTLYWHTHLKFCTHTCVWSVRVSIMAIQWHAHVCMYYGNTLMCVCTMVIPWHTHACGVCVCLPWQDYRTHSRCVYYDITMAHTNFIVDTLTYNSTRRDYPVVLYMSPLLHRMAIQWHTQIS